MKMKRDPLFTLGNIYSNNKFIIFKSIINFNNHLRCNSFSSKCACNSACKPTSSIIIFAATADGMETQSSMESSVQTCRHFDFCEILLATANFDDALVIGKGGFGKVYKGNIINGSSVAVAAIKRLDLVSSQGASEFWAEVEMLSNLRHCHLVSLFGYCNYEKEMILIYEYMPNGTLEDHLHKLGTPLSWLQRLKICIGAARGLDYLHTGTGIDLGVIHRDVKPSNILLHESWSAKISDFGLSKIGPTNQPCTYINTLVKGTFGYFDPNYFTTGKLTRKSDVYAFGVVLLEVLCRKRAVDNSLDVGLATWAQDSIKEGNLKHIIDSSIRCQISSKCLKEFVRIVERCLLSNPKRRPTMAEVVVGLESVLNLQEKRNSLLQPAGRTIFGRMVDRFPSLSSRENSAHGGSDLSTNNKGDNRNVGDTVVDNEDFTIPMPSLKVFKFVDLKKATRNFSQHFLLGRGGLGEVFLGWVDKNTLAPSREGVGIAVAVKRYSEDLPEWETVVTGLGELSHPNIVSVLGYSDDKKHQCLLVYEYIHNRNLGRFLFQDEHDFVEPLSWGTRLMIMIGVARGLAFMHSSKNQVIHGHVEPSNIYLDQNFNAKLGDFVLAKFGPEIQKLDSITTGVMCSLGYFDSQYLSTGHLTVKSDIYSFGVVLLETLIGHRAWSIEWPISEFNLVDRDKAFK
ncbi:putative receptor-like protein kinase At5g39000 isoform X2 [Lactuca sativa]|uniref:putative receptor-like protein kinase At5g39000 isoform X2 n=1 Tax=Lactuca sativa TaxID=4236 RepID=UPI001C6908F0|nr:putative receptor-like protein kinase At5g39000 isoform X2 [Lactuca sativa]